MIIPDDEQCVSLSITDGTDGYGAAITITEAENHWSDVVVISRKQAPLVIAAIEKWMRGEDIG